MKSARHIALLSFLMLCSLLIQASEKYTLSGIIKDKKSGETLIGATIRVMSNKTLGAVSNDYGFYSLTLPKGKYEIAYGYVGFQEQILVIQLDSSLTQDINLAEAGRELKEVTIQATAKNAQVTNAQMGITKLDIKEISMIPVLFGERDVMKTIQLLPGVKTASEGNSGFYVRGGTADQNLIILDEAVVYNPSHFLGFFSTFNSDAIKDVTLYKGTAPAQYGSRLSSVLDVKMNNGNDQDYHVSGGIGLISSKINIEGPIKKDESSFLFSARRTYADLFLKLSPDTSINSSQLYFYDVNAKLNYKLSKKDHLYLSGYFGKDYFNLGGNFGIFWSNTTSTLRWNHLFNDKLFSNTSLIYSNYLFKIKINLNGFDAGIRSQIKDQNFKQEFTYYPNPKNSIRIGFNSILHTITPGEFTIASSTSTKENSKSWENAIYVSNNQKLASNINLEYGIRLSTFSVLGGNDLYTLNVNNEIADTIKTKTNEIYQTFVNPQPRMNISYILNEKSSIKGSYTRNVQYLHLISNSNASNPSDKWVSSNNIIKPQIADQGSIGYFRNFNNNLLEASAETYFKSSQNQLDYKDGANIYTNNPIEPLLLFGQGRAYGLEVLLRKKQGRFTGWIGYTLSKAEIQIGGINNNQWYSARQDRTHDVSVVGIYKLNKKWTVSATWVYYTGSAVSFPTGKYMVDNQVRYYYTERNGYRMPSYHRLDLGATKTIKKSEKYAGELSFSLYNAYGQQNAYFIEFKQDPKDASKTIVEQVSLFRFVPSISYNFKF